MVVPFQIHGVTVDQIIDFQQRIPKTARLPEYSGGQALMPLIAGFFGSQLLEEVVEDGKDKVLLFWR